MLGVIVSWLVTAGALILIARLNVGVEVADFKQALIAALVIGLVNAIVGPVLHFLAFPLTFITLGLFTLVINALLFGLAAALVPGFSLRNGFISALIGSVLLTIIRMVVFAILEQG